VTKQVCEPREKEIIEQVCVEIPSQKASRVCKDVTRMECDVIERPDTRVECDVLEAPTGPPPPPPPPQQPQRVCKFVPRPVEREVCKDVKMRAFTEQCKEVPVQRPEVDCGTQMMPLSLKEICVKIDFQLPRQECKLEKREDCRYYLVFLERKISVQITRSPDSACSFFISRYVPREKTVQRCDPVVREECSMKMRTDCNDVCAEDCQVQDKKICMTIPHQECQEKPVQSCQDIPQTKCRKVCRLSLTKPLLTFYNTTLHSQFRFRVRNVPHSSELQLRGRDVGPKPE
jgi:hypothetical protein